jgi:Na+/proline symporter
VAEGALQGFGWVDWAVVAGFLVGVTVLGERLAGKQSSIRDFFLGGRRLPWYAVAASIVATEISAVTLVGLPAVVFRDGGNLAYLQIGLFGSLIARWMIALWLVPAYYEREIYSPYDYMGQRLGGRVRGATTTLFALGGVLGQSARVYLIAVVLEVILHSELGWVEAQTGLPPLVSAVSAIVLVSLLWTLMGGITTVVWTDALLFCVFLAAAVIALVTVVSGVEGGAGEVLRVGGEAGKLQLVDTTLTLRKPYTIWAALVAQSWAGLAPYGVDQLMAQRLFCCRGVAEARKAIVASYAGVAVIVLVGLVGVALYAWYRHHPLTGEALALYEGDPDRIFPIFVLEAIPTGLRGLILAGVFAAAISSLDSILAALSQTVLSAVYLPWRERNRPAGFDEADEHRRAVRVSRALVVVFALLLGAMAVFAADVKEHYKAVLDLALALAGYTQGALLAGFFLAWRKRPAGRDLGSGFVWSAALSVLAVFVVAWRQPWAETAYLIAACTLVGLWLLLRVWIDRATALAPSLFLALGLLGLGWLQHAGTEPLVAWPWYVPIGCGVCWSFAWLLARRREPSASLT